MSRIIPQPAGTSARDWTMSSGQVPLAANVRATCTQPAAGVGLCNVCTSLTVLIAANASIGTASTISVGLIDGVSGTANKFIWGPLTFGIPNVGGATNGVVNIPVFRIGSPNTAMTLEFSGAVANAIESLDCSGTVMVAGVGLGV